MMTQVDKMNSELVTYGILQGVVLLGLMVRLIMYLSFQKRLSVIGGTLVRIIIYGRRLAPRMFAIVVKHCPNMSWDIVAVDRLLIDNNIYNHQINSDHHVSIIT